MSFLATDFLLKYVLDLRSLGGLRETAEKIEGVSHCGLLNRLTILGLGNPFTLKLFDVQRILLGHVCPFPSLP